MTISSDDVHEEFNVEIIRDKCVEKRSVNWLKRLISFPAIFLKKIYNSYLLIRHAELRKAAEKNVHHKSWINVFSSLFFSMRITANQHVMREMLKHPRKDPANGLFDDEANIKSMLVLLKDMYPLENINVDDFLLTCNKEYINQYRFPILQFIGPQNIRKHCDALQNIVAENIDYLGHSNNFAKINIEDISLIFTTSVISKLLLGHPGPFVAYQEISLAIGYLNKIIMKKVWKRPLSQSENQEYEKSLGIVRDAIEFSLNVAEKPHLGSFGDMLRHEKSMTTIQIKCMFFLMYFAGSETTASLLTYMLWQLGQHPTYQEKILQEINQSDAGILLDHIMDLEFLNNLFAESIRLYTPGYVIGRRSASDLRCTIKDKQGDIIYQHRIPKDETILAAPTFAARNPCLYQQPDKFNPERFLSSQKNLPWLPFGFGKHVCPGQWLAKAEILLFISALVKEYKFTSTPDKEMQVKGYMTLKPGSAVWLSLEKRLN